MLEKVILKNYILFQNSEVDFKSGFNVLVGETGAGKSIILSAIQFALGQRADKSVIKKGQSYAKVTLCFFVDKQKEIFSNLGIDVEDERLIVSRMISIDGKNECRVNGEIVTVSMLKSICDNLVDSYYQNEAVRLLNVKNHLPMLDSYAEKELCNLKIEINTLNNEITEIKSQLEGIGGSFENRERELSLLDYQINEIENAKLSEDEEDILISKIKLINNSEKISNALSNSITLLNGDRSSIVNIKNAISELMRISGLSDKVDKALTRLESLRYDLEDINNELETANDEVFYDEVLLESLDNRLDEIKSIKKKYGNSIIDINNFLLDAKQKYDLLLNADTKLNKLNNLKAQKSKALYNLCIKQSEIRKKAALNFEKEITKQLCSLGMKNAQLKVSFSNIEEYSEEFNRNSIDMVEFMFSANLGQELKSIVKSISGGEMSRFMLALKVVLTAAYNIPILILDEVDAGISGEIGTIVAEKISIISKNIQVICITHMPQVTAMADNYIFVYKNQVDGETESFEKVLNETEQIDYIAKLFSANASESAIKSAIELKNWCNNFKKSV